MVGHWMGPNPLWLLEDLAREYGVEVTAVDLWISAQDNDARFHAAGVRQRVRALTAEAHALPFEEGAFDAIVSVDSYHYFGTADLYIGYITHFLTPGGQLAIAVSALRQELRDLAGVPDYLRRRRLGGVARYRDYPSCCAK